MTLVELLSTLRTRDINIWADGERLRYSAPSGALTPDIREELAKHKTHLLTFLSETVRVRQVTRAPIGRISREAKLVPSINQRRLWFIDRLQPNTAFNCCTAFRIKGSLNLDALEQSLNEIARRHEVLRTTFAEIDGEPVQVISPNLKLEIPVVDLRGIVDSAERELETQRILTAEAERPFDLAKGPLFRAYLVYLATDEYLLQLALHHIVTDAWSMGILVKELTVLYEAFCHGRSSPLPELPIQYADFAHWQSEWMQGEVLQQELSHWRERLRGAPEVTELLTDYPRPAVQNFQGAREPVVISKSLTEALKTLSKKRGVTLFMTLLAAFKTLLYRYTGQDDLLVGSPIAGRIRVDMENLIGLFINTLVLRTDLSGSPTFGELLKRVREVALDAYAHQEVPFEKLLEDLQLERRLSFSSLFQVMFVLQNTPESELQLLGLDVSPVTIKRETALFDLFLSLSEKDQGLHGTLSYRTDLFDRVTIRRMVGGFEVLLHGIVADPDRPISALPLLMEAEKHQLVVVWNDTESPYLQAKCVHQLFEEQVERIPDAVAVIFGDQQLTYRELNARANQLAHYLRKQRVGLEVAVGICMERSLDMVVGLLSVLKAGGAYVPLDPQYPKDRLAFMLEDTQAPILLTQEQVLEVGIEDRRRKLALSEAEGIEDGDSRFSIFDPRIQVVCLDRDWEKIEKESEENPDIQTTTENLAYVIYTSGSTGTPKGVEITHRALTNFTTSACASFALASADRVLQFASISFDAAAEEIYPSLVCGAGITLRTDSMLDSVSSFLQCCAEWKVTVLDLPTAYWHELVEQMVAEGLTFPDGLRLVIIGGERAVPERLAQWRSVVGDHVRLLNTYGPTEATVVATTWESAGAAAANQPAREVPIGRPIANVRTYVLDRQLNTVPIGVSGELHIGGVGLARGYLNHPDLTAERFIPDLFGNESGGRLYRTGDLVRYLPDGKMEFLERIDQQVKLRGFRIELGEIEAVLSQHPAVMATVVLAREDTPGDKRLVAYAVLKSGQILDATAARSFLKEKLPDYMVPSVFVFLDRLPLTPNEKIDRKALPAPDHSRREVGERFVAPRTPTEEMLAEIWAKLLGIDGIGIRDSFFHLGGHSMLAVRLFAEIEKAFKKRPPLSGLFQEPTIEHLATLITQENRTKAPSSLVAIQLQGSKRPFFCVHTFFGDIFCYMNLARHLGQDQPFYAIEARGLNGVEEPFDDIKTMAAHYIEQIRTVQPQGPYALGGLCSAGIVAFEMAQQLRAKGEQVAMVALLDSSLPDRSNGKTTSRWGFVRDLILDIPAWLMGSLELNRSQWTDLIDLKVRMARAKKAVSNGSDVNPQNRGGRLIWEMADFFHFSEQHYKIARSHSRALRDYKPQIYAGRLTLFKARMQPLFSLHKPDKGWQAVAAGGLEVRVVPGNQLAMLKEPHVQVLAEQLRSCLDKALTEVNGRKSLTDPAAVH